MKQKIKRSVLSVLLVACFFGMMIGVLQNQKASLPVPASEKNNMEEKTIEEKPPTEHVPEESLTAEEETVIPEITLVMVGDILLHTKVTESGKMDDGSYTYSHLFDELKDVIQSADLAIVNQEVILGGIELGLSGYPSFNGAYEVGHAIADAGFDVVLHATNHTLDKGKKGVLNTLAFWENNYPDIAVLGIQDSQAKQDDSIYVYEQEGIRVAVLNYTYGMNGIPLPKDMPFIVNMLDQEKIARDIALAKERSDFVIVAPHWGTEYIFEASKEQKEWAQFFAEQGVDLVIGTHPHVIEPIEWVESSTGHKMLVYYSLGNFVNATSGTGEGVGARMVGGMAKVTLIKDKNNQVTIKDYGVEPLVTHLEEGPGNITTYKLSDYSEEMANVNQIVNQDPTFSYDFAVTLCEKVFGELFVKESNK